MRIVRLVLIALLALVAVLVLRALGLRSHQLRVEPAPAIALDESALAQRLGAAVRFETVSSSDGTPVPRDAFLAFHRFLAESYPRLHAATTLERVSELSLLYTWRGSDPALQPIQLSAHQDVVPIVDPERWTHPPFSGAIDGGFVWGRGSIDDKSQVLGMCEAVEHLLAQGFAPKRTVILTFGHDEEVGGSQGAAKLAELLVSRGVRAAFGVDEGLAMLVGGAIPGVTRPTALIGVAEKGSVTLEIVARAEGGHSSTPPRHTAAGALARAVQRVEGSPFPGGLGGVTGGMFSYLAPEMPFPARVPLANLWLFAKPMDWILSGQPAVNAMLRTTTAVTMLSGSPKENVLPTQAIATVNFRILPGDTTESVLARVRGLVDDPTIEVRFKDPGRDPSPVSPSDAPAFALLQRTIGEVFPDAIVAPGLVLAATDSRHYPKLSPNLYRFGPFRFDRDDLRRPHGIDERIATASYADGVRFYVRLIENASRAFEAP